MAVLLAMLQAGSAPDRDLYIILGVIILATLVALGLKFFVNMFEVITAPGASLRHHGQADNFFFSIFVVFLGGLIGTIGLFFKQAAISEGFAAYANQVCTDIAMGNGNAIYRDIAADWGANTMMDHFGIFVVNNLIFFPVIMVLLWLVIGLFSFVGTKLFGGVCTLSNLLSSLAYSALFASIGLAFLFLSAIKGVTAGGVPEMSVLGIIGAVLLVYALVLMILGIAGAADLQIGQAVGVLIFLLVIFGGIGYGIYHMTIEPWETFQSTITSYDPSRGTY